MHAQSQRWDPSRQCMAWYGFNWHTSYAIPPLWAHLRDVCWWQRLLCASEVQRTLVYITLQCLMGCHSSSRSVFFYGSKIRDRPIYWFTNIFFPIFKHFTIIGYNFFFYICPAIIQSITSSEMCSLHLTHPSAHTPGAVDTHTHTWSSGHCSLRRSSSTTTACNFIQDSLVWNTLNYINIYYRTIISPINISIEMNYLFSPQAIVVWVVLCK